MKNFSGVLWPKLTIIFKVKSLTYMMVQNKRLVPVLVKIGFAVSMLELVKDIQGIFLKTTFVDSRDPKVDISIRKHKIDVMYLNLT